MVMPARGGQRDDARTAATRPKVPIRVLILEDNPADAELMVHALERAGFEPKWERVETGREFAARLTPEIELILSDYSLPEFDGPEALRLIQ
ncbi:MAG: response regulator [Betaproteobacteria bacterium]|nr:response regulator [Betaproteobacteria bacterium]